MCVGKIYKRSTALVVDFSAANSMGAGITGLTVKFSIYDVATSMYWDNASGAFDSVAEVLNTAAEIGEGLYNYVLTGGYALGGNEYVVHTEATASVTGDTYDTAETYMLTVDANLTMIEGASTVDTRTITSMFELVSAMAAGRFQIGVPSSGKLTVYMADGITPLIVFDITTDERDPV